MRVLLQNNDRLSDTDEVLGLYGQNINRMIQAECRTTEFSTEKTTSNSGRAT